MATLKERFENFSDKVAEKLNALKTEIGNISPWDGLSEFQGQSLGTDLDGKIYYKERTPEEIKSAILTLLDTNFLTDAQKQIIEDLASGLANKVDKVTGEGLTPQKFTLEEKQKLAAIEDAKWRGQYTTFENLTAEYPEGSGQTWHQDLGGWNADVDAGPGADVQHYIWDSSDLAWKLQTGSSTAETAASIKTKYESNADTNAFTDSHKNTVESLPAQVEPLSTKKTAWNKDYGLIAGTTAQGNDQRILNGQAAFEALPDLEVRVSDNEDAIDAHTLDIADLEANKANDSEVVKDVLDSNGASLKDENGQVQLPAFVGGGVITVTGDGVDNTDSNNPVISFPTADEIDDSTTTKKLVTQNLIDKVTALDQAVVLKNIPFDASIGTFPPNTEAGWTYIVGTAGTVNGIVFSVGDRLTSLLDNASTTTFAGNWFHEDYSDVSFKAELEASGSKSTPIDADIFSLLDTAASNALKKITWANIKATLKTYFDGIYATIGAVATAKAEAISSANTYTDAIDEPITVDVSRALTAADRRKILHVIANVTLTYPNGGIAGMRFNIRCTATGQATIAGQAADLDMPNKVVLANKAATFYREPVNGKLTGYGELSA